MKQENYLFYGSEAKSYISAKEVVGELNKLLPKINSLIDLGCGMAAFAKIFQENGVKEITLIDHPSLDVSNCLIKDNFQFIPCDLDNYLPLQLKADLVICTEVLEHINLKRSIEILDYIVSCTDIVIFSAAIPKQGGTGHINEQHHKFWIDKFKERGFEYTDSFKAHIIKNKKIHFYLRQNLFIFFRNQAQHSPLKNAKWIDEDFEIVNISVLEREYGFMKLLKMLPKAFKSSALFWLRRLKKNASVNK